MKVLRIFSVKNKKILSSKMQEEESKCLILPFDVCIDEIKENINLQNECGKILIRGMLCEKNKIVGESTKAYIDDEIIESEIEYLLPATQTIDLIQKGLNLSKYGLN